MGTQALGGGWLWPWPTGRMSSSHTRAALTAARHGDITTEIVDAPEFWYAEGYHQQYLYRNPMGYCVIGGTGVSCPVGLT
jgi:peptide-methionine (S)-S-oxide reductase